VTADYKAVRHYQPPGYWLIDYWLLRTFFNDTVNNFRMTASIVLELMSSSHHFTGGLRKTTTKLNDTIFKSDSRQEY
jgi:hypothetical protein